MKNNPSYPSKIMLVGEYGVVVGGTALTIPFHKFDATVRSIKNTPPGKELEAEQSLHYLRLLFQFIQNLPEESFHAHPDLGKFEENLQSYWLDMNIPIGYGLGSSGAVSAAIYDLFFPTLNTLTLQEQKEDLASIESYFHGKSSGVDALTCHTRSALRFHTSGTIEKVTLDPLKVPGGYRFFLLDSGVKFDTGPLVKHFLNQMEDPGFKRVIEEEFLPLNEKLIETLLGEREADPGLLVRLLSDFQFRHFSHMIPEKMLDIWIEGQVSNEYYLKLNGSGGGFMLGITHQTSMDSLEMRWGEKLIWVS
jgi:mevalonate kinase